MPKIIIEEKRSKGERERGLVCSTPPQYAEIVKGIHL
jgi:hypothetical protein